MRDVELLPGERLDDLQRNGYKIIQHADRFCFGMDAVLLTGFVELGTTEVVLDMGTGTGIIPLLLKGKLKGRRYVGLEVQEEIADMARRSVRYNALEDSIDMVRGDLREAAALFGAASFDVVTVNPPYIQDKQGLPSETTTKDIARHERLCTLEDVAREAGKVLKPRGRLYMVHRPYRLIEIVRELTKYQLEPKRMRLVHPYADKEPNLVLLEAVKGGRPRLRVEKPLVLCKEKGEYTDEVNEWYRF